MTFLLAYLNTEYDFEERLSCKPQVDHFFPCCILPPWKMGRWEKSWIFLVKLKLLNATILESYKVHFVIIDCWKIFLFLWKLDYSFNQTPVPNHMEHVIKIVSLYHETGHDNFFEIKFNSVCCSDCCIDWILPVFLRW